MDVCCDTVLKVSFLCPGNSVSSPLSECKPGKRLRYVWSWDSEKPKVLAMNLQYHYSCPFSFTVDVLIVVTFCCFYWLYPGKISLLLNLKRKLKPWVKWKAVSLRSQCRRQKSSLLNLSVSLHISDSFLNIVWFPGCNSSSWLWFTLPCLFFKGMQKPLYLSKENLSHCVWDWIILNSRWHRKKLENSSLPMACQGHRFNDQMSEYWCCCGWVFLSLQLSPWRVRDSWMPLPRQQLLHLSGKGNGQSLLLRSDEFLNTIDWSLKDFYTDDEEKVTSWQTLAFPPKLWYK